MASSSSSLTLLAPSSSLPRTWIHHVFPSFHGADVRTNILSHILKEFKSKGINSFIDNDIERSKSIGPKLVEAIRGSRIAIVLLSKGYASSTWCLNELVEIINCREELGQIVISIFYQVDPTHVKKQTGGFGKVFRETCKGKTKKKIQRWKHALTEVAQIAGYHSTNWETEAKMIEDIAIDVSNKLNNSAPSSDFDGLVGMGSHMEKMGKLLQLDSIEVRMIGILGPPGIGKTTIARFLFNQHSLDFEICIFMDNIKRKYTTMACSDDYNVKLDLQKQFMSLLTNDTGIKISHLGIIKDRLKDKKVLLVFDDVDRLVQLEALAKEISWFGPGSRIITTTQDKKILKASGVNHIYMVNLPSSHEAHELFCKYAFGQNGRKNGFRNQDLASGVVRLVGGLPLGLKVMGSYFRGMSEKDWTEELPRLRTHLDRDGEIANILKFSYDALCNEDKDLFLHIACFFDHQPVDIVESCLTKCFTNVKQGIRVLAEKSLISIEYGWIKMAELLVQLGRKIVQEQFVSEIGKRRFLNDANAIDEVLDNDIADGSNVIGIHLTRDITCTSERAFERFSNLRFLRMDNNHVNSQSLNYISQKLIVLIWWNFEMSCFPSSFDPKFLVYLYMPRSKLKKLWKGIKPLNNLKWMRFGSSESLVKLPDLSTATNLYNLDLNNCLRLVELPFSIGNAISLKELNFSGCSSLVKLPSSIGNAINLQKLNLIGCSCLVKLPSSIGNAINLQELHLTHCSSLVELPSSIGNAISLRELDLRYCSELVELPSSIGNAINLRKLNLSNCSSLVKLPSSIGNAINLQELNLKRCSRLVELPSSIGNAINLRKMNLKCCSRLVELPSSIGNVIFNFQKLNLKYCSSLVKLPSSIGNATNLQELHLKRCSSLAELPSSMRKLGRLRNLELKKCSKLEVVLDNINLESMEYLNHSGCYLLKGYHESSTDIEDQLYPWVMRISRLRRLVLGMKKLVSLPQLPDSLLFLEAQNCKSLERLDCSFRNPNIRLNFKNCFKLNQEARDLIIQTRTNTFAVFPGGEVPMCFTYQSSGSSVTVKLNQMHFGTSTKFKACIIFAGEDERDVSALRRSYVCCSVACRGNAFTACYKEVERVVTGHLYTFEVEVDTEELTSTELVFEFEHSYSLAIISHLIESEDNYCWDLDRFKIVEIKECGVLQLLEVPLC